MPKENLTNHALRGIRKALQGQADRLERREQQRSRAAERAMAPPKPPRRREWERDTEDPQPATGTGRRGRALKAPSGIITHPPAVATVVEAIRGHYLVAHNGSTHPARLGGGMTLPSIVTGDRVRLTGIDTGAVRIQEVLPRTSALVRWAGDASRRRGIGEAHLLAANVDQVIVVCTPAAPPFRPALIDRYLVAASRDCLTPVICLNKIDLGESDETVQALAAFERLGIEVLRTSAQTGHGITDLRQALAGKTSLFTGHSGVGKSSLLNALEPDLALRVGGVTETAAGQGKGRHTTTSARLVPLPQPDTFVVDSPGIRAFAIGGIAPRALARHFPDLDAVAGECRFRGCLHQGEAGCRIEEAAAGPWLARRLASYRKLLREVGAT